MEHKLATAHTEMQRLLTENQRLAVTLMAPLQEQAQGEVQRLRLREASIWKLMERNAAVTEDLRTIEPLKKEGYAARVGLHSL
ncbi:hypothetical protein CBR_g22082 [Chara braunii]|uniref:Uncharacterized protein n=1 Tax=Chara braunii TaxID=69332 RepID=A0A388L1Z6_CHABU|nr:hypothetical protein CBR_g22082 [Chara braunii]|eukprot:GBG76335.1 hypothetical protein CBR_g22082 [Chara braunii]